ncbi:hypothetical protein C5C99_01395 [Rathayibacter sp. AY1C4]|nr:hypothetical protein C5C99_01395 [Rathayibacter sp. AY1C4]
MRGDLDLMTVSPVLRLIVLHAYDQGHAAGRTSCQKELDRSNREADRLWLQLNNSPAEVEEILRNQMDEGSRTYWEEWLRGEHDGLAPEESASLSAEPTACEGLTA